MSVKRWTESMKKYVDARIKAKNEFKMEYLDIDNEITEENAPYLVASLKEKGITCLTNSYFGSGVHSPVKQIFEMQRYGYRMKRALLIPDYSANRSLGIAQDAPDAYKKWALLYQSR